MRTLILILCAVCAIVKGEPLKEVLDGSGKFATNFIKKVTAKNGNGNLVSSPLSAYLSLSMAAYGSDGNTAKEMRQSLHLPNNDVNAHQGFKSLINDLNNMEDVTLEVANKIYLSNNFKAKANFKALTTNIFDSETAEIDVYQPSESVKVINNWIDNKTHHKISEILNEEDIGSNTRMILLNAVYFDAEWMVPFEEDETKDLPFLVDGKIKKCVPTMHMKTDFVNGDLPKLKASFVEIPYKNYNVSLVIILPNENQNLADLAAELENLNYREQTEYIFDSSIDLLLPKFKIESTIDLGEPLQQMGMVDMFSNNANFQGINEKPMKVSKILQKAYIEVNEKGSEAGAGTVINNSNRMKSDTFNFHVDRPFLFLIATEELTLFVGTVTDPSVEKSEDLPNEDKWYWL